MFYQYCTKKELTHTINYKLPEVFHKAFNFNDEIIVYWGSFMDPVAKGFFHHTALIAFNKKNEIISAISFGSEGYIKVLETVNKICGAKTREEQEEYKEEFLDVIDMMAIEKI